MSVEERDTLRADLEKARAEQAAARREIEKRGQQIVDAMGRYRGHEPLIEAVARLSRNYHQAEQRAASLEKELAETQETLLLRVREEASERDRRVAAQEAIMRHWEPRVASLEAQLAEAHRGYQHVLYDLGLLLEALGKPNVARPDSPQTVMRECIADVRALSEQVRVYEEGRVLSALKAVHGDCPGWVEVCGSAHAPGCDGTCSVGCPVPVQEQERCEVCDVIGQAERARQAGAGEKGAKG